MDRTPFRPGDQAYINGKPVVIVHQVLFNRSAYRVQGQRRQSRMPTEERVVDGTYISTDATRRVGFPGPRTAHAKPDAA